MPDDYANDVLDCFVRAIAQMATASNDSTSFTQGVRAAIILFNGMLDLNPDQTIGREVLKRLTWEMVQKNRELESVFRQR
jgi:hypothetical protein